ncbi:hypothetical protein BDW22DRAFT_853246 [Trametopsis cervina]|nr:hypothetical protein BDW22DRAFT_853246 [Trametopsis cervina]
MLRTPRFVLPSLSLIHINLAQDCEAAAAGRICTQGVHGGTGLYLADEVHNFPVLPQKEVLSGDQQGRAIRGPQPQAARILQHIVQLLYTCSRLLCLGLSSLNLTHRSRPS